MGRSIPYMYDEAKFKKFHRRIAEGRSSEATPSNESEDKEDAILVVNEHDDEITAWEKTIRDTLQERHIHQSSREEPFITIPKLPERLSFDSDRPYDPHIISIGPYHRGDYNGTMEEHKWQYMQAILSRNTEVSLKDYIKEIEALKVRARNCYSKEEFYLRDEAFVETMLLDGCFIIEYLLRKNAKEDNDLGGMIWMEDLLLRDLLLLENQLPFFVLERIFYLATKKNPPSLLVQVVVDFFNKSTFFPKRTGSFFPERTGSPLEPIHHLLHLYHWFLLSTPLPLESVNVPLVNPFQRIRLNFMKILVGFGALISSKHRHSTEETTETKKGETETKKGETIKMIPNAMVLQEAGIKFKKREVEGGCFLDVKFNDGVMEIPPLLIDAFTKPTFRNLIAFEQFYPYTEAKFTTYVIFLDNIVNTPEDVRFLHRNGIIEHMFGSDEEVARLFNDLIKGTFSRPTNYLSDLYREVDKYHRARKHRWWASFVRKYLNSPLKILSMVAAIIFLVLSFLQTFFSVYSYFHPPS